MYLLKSYQSSLTVKDLKFFGGITISMSAKIRTLYTNLTAEEKSPSIAGLLLTLVFLIHIWAIIWLKQTAETKALPQPLMMEVLLISAPSKQQETVPAAQPKVVEPLKQAEKKPVKEKRQVTSKQVEHQKPQPNVSEITQSPQIAKPAMETNVAKVSENVPLKMPAESNNRITEANYQANYGSNPKPKYPAIAMRRGWEGTVQLSVQVSSEGASEKVTVHHSSGYDALDEAAVEAVEKWRFIPAKRGDTPIASSVIVPINFVLNN
jgi:protein TonB